MNMIRFILILMICFCFACPAMISSTTNSATASTGVSNYDAENFETSTQNFVVTANKANIFKNADFASDVLKTLSLKNVVQVTFTDNKPIETLKDNFVFYSVKFADVEGFMLADLLVPEQKFLTSIPKFNAQTNTEAFSYMKVLTAKKNLQQSLMLSPIRTALTVSCMAT